MENEQIVITGITASELKKMVNEDQSDRDKFVLLPSHLSSLLKYVEQRIPPGSFLMAVLCNNLAEACGRADLQNRRRLFEYVQYLYNDAPSACWGSKEKVDAWLAEGRHSNEQ